MVREFDRKIVLEDGCEYPGYSFGSRGERITEIVFNTSMVGYQEILSDPSYTYQSVVMTYPVIGNYGINRDDMETYIPTLCGFIVRDYNNSPSNFRCQSTLSDVMKKYGVTGIYGVDTRALTRKIRNQGTQNVLITDISTPREAALEMLAAHKPLRDAVKSVSCLSQWKSASSEAKYHIAAIDCGIKHNIIRKLNEYGCDVTVVPYNSTAADIKRLNPDGVFISNGPGDPQDVHETIELVRSLRGKYPMFGICLGHQIIALAYGGSTYKLKFGHRGGNHPVKNLKSGKIEITSQNHSYAVDEASLSGRGLDVTHVNLLDSTVEGMENIKDRVFSVQYHPESAPGPEDSAYLFGRFINMIKENT